MLHSPHPFLTLPPWLVWFYDSLFRFKDYSPWNSWPCCVLARDLAPISHCSRKFNSLDCFTAWGKKGIVHTMKETAKLNQVHSFVEKNPLLHQTADALRCLFIRFIRSFTYLMWSAYLLFALSLSASLSDYADSLVAEVILKDVKCLIMFNNSF